MPVRAQRDIDLSRIADSYVRRGYRGARLRKALEQDAHYQKRLAQRKQSIVPAIPVSAAEKKRYVFSVDDDYAILALCKHLERKDLSPADKELVALINAQLRDDWRQPLLKALRRLKKKYRG